MTEPTHTFDYYLRFMIKEMTIYYSKPPKTEEPEPECVIADIVADGMPVDAVDVLEVARSRYRQIYLMPSIDNKTPMDGILDNMYHLFHDELTKFAVQEGYLE